MHAKLKNTSAGFMLRALARMGMPYERSEGPVEGGLDHEPGAPDDVDAAMTKARSRFAADFVTVCERMAALIEQVGSARDERSAADLAQTLHQLGGLGGTIGFPRVSERARDLEDFVRDTPIARFDPTEARRRLDAVRRAFDEDRCR